MSARDAIIKARFMHQGETHEDQVWERVATAWSNTDEEAAEFLRLMTTRRAFPNTPAIANAGRDHQMGSACFVLPIEDSLEGIMDTLRDAALVQKAGGGTGFDFSRLRPAGSIVGGTGREAPGPASFLAMYSSAIAHVTQAGMRPGANMCVIRCDHPDVYRVLDTKANEGTIHNFNISVAITDQFMLDLANGAKHARDLWDRVTWGAWANGEPGVIFIDKVNARAYHPEVIEATNPCGEVPLLPYEACVLGSINLAEHVTKKGDIDWTNLERTTKVLTRLLDNVVDLQDYPIERIKRTHHRYRKIGVGVMGYADMLVKLGVRYGTDEARYHARNVMRFVQASSYKQSEAIAAMKAPYPAFDHGLPKRRNLMCQVIAPTGTISRLAGCSFGIEPHFDREYTSFILGGEYPEAAYGADSDYFVPAREVTPGQHVATQAAFQDYTDQAVSKTVNLPEEATIEDVSNTYKQAYHTGCKGITVLRERSRSDVVIDCATGTCAL